MTEYTVRAPEGVTLPVGVIVRLTEAQLRNRFHQVLKREDGSMQAREPLSFKAGEKIELQDEVIMTKGLREAFGLAVAPPPRPARALRSVAAKR